MGVAGGGRRDGRGRRGIVMLLMLLVLMMPVVGGVVAPVGCRGRSQGVAILPVGLLVVVIHYGKDLDDGWPALAAAEPRSK